MIAIIAALALTNAQASQPHPVDRAAEIWSAASDRIQQQDDVWFEDGDFPRVIQLLRVAWEIDLSDYEVATNLGWMLENVEDYPSALKVYQRYSVVNPHDPDRTFPEAFYYYQKKQYTLVPPLLEPVLASRPQDNAFRILAGAYDKLKRYDDAVRVWKAYLRIRPEDGAAKANLARLEKKVGSGG